MKSFNTSHIKCDMLPNKELQCIKHNNIPTWKLVNTDEKHETMQCSSNSVPWEMQALCKIQENERKCFSTTYGAVCIQRNKNSNPMPKEIINLEKGLKVSLNKSLNEKEIEGLVPCYSQDFNGLSNSKLVTLVDKSNIGVCENIAKKAKEEEFSNCIKDKTKCNKTVKFHFDNFHPHKTPYTCSLDISKLPYASNDNNKWWAWHRKNQHDSEENGWKIIVDENTHIRGEKCSMHSECKSTFETGVCKKGTCIKGALNSRCNTDENCDLYKGSEGKCSNGECISGKTNVYATYMAPSACTMDTHGKSKYSYCGKIVQNGTASFTGVCTKYKNNNNEKTYACKEFKSKKEIDNYRNEELDWISIKRSDNFSPQFNNWERLNVCPESFKENINGNDICTATRSIVHLTDETEASSFVRASQKCMKNACKRSCPSELCNINTQTNQCEPANNKMHIERGKGPHNGCKST